jgi:hypothetical protein
MDWAAAGSSSMRRILEAEGKRTFFSGIAAGLSGVSDVCPLPDGRGSVGR